MKCPPEIILVSRAPLGSCCPETRSQVPSRGLFFVWLPFVCEPATNAAVSAIAITSNVFLTMSSFDYWGVARNEKGRPENSDRPLNLIPATTYVPTQLPVQYHRPCEA